MAELSKNTWSKINDFLLTMNTRHSINEMNLTLLNELPDLLHFENSGVLIEVNEKLKPEIKKSTGMGNNWAILFNNYYYKIATPGFPEVDKNIFKANYKDQKFYSKDEYVNDFIYAQNICYSAGFIVFGLENKPAAIVVLNRTKDEHMFTEDELTMLKTIQPHISAFYKTIGTIEEIKRMPVQKLELHSDNKLLSIRESEIVSLLLKRLRPKEIAKELNISTGTVRKHIENIYYKLNVMDRHELFRKINL
jgi:DNA-binding CsgD family transcriptional regulator